jgi:hypothetical protein
MEKLKQNGFWVALGVVLAAIVMGFVYLVVLTEWPARQTAENKLKSLNSDLKGYLENQSKIPSQAQIRTYNERMDELKTELESCKKWYLGYDEALEKWFEGLPSPPPEGMFKAQYDTNCANLVKELEAAKISHGPVKEEGVDPLFAPGVGAGPAGALAGIKWAEVGGLLDLADIQKRFWITQRISMALLQIQQEAPGSIVALEELRFAPGAKGLPGERYPGWPTSTFELPGKYGKVITCGFRVVMSNAHAPKLIKLLLDTDGPGPKLLSHLRGVRIVPSKTLQNKIEESIKVKEGENVEAAKAARMKELQAVHGKPTPIRIFVTYEVFDFDSGKIAKPFVPKG